MTLIEALITLFVLSIGLLGMAALQLVSIQENSSAFRHTQAIWFANDMADRMRANLVGVVNGQYGRIPATSPHVSTTSATDCSLVTACDCDQSSANCDNINMALFDIYEWRELINSTSGAPALPNGIGTIDDIGSGRYRIRVMWDDDTRTNADTTGCPLDSSITQTCVEITIQP